ncbi:translocation/assembly module TamB domain-containing protein [Alcanivorax sp. JB21]|uniref:translocation/assembly module TamB domain-containing protein n=1 Tax=Alcanivorax limicola TaxID=2874102 RepID=UPI001CBF004B|nr:translocation/assembly module TamB domain-containing protein [Alcanivorax limicola]MBZ2189875.1 translocation/assembly module TamB domain-containing protein [Alcanivorax limicola]
MSPASIMQALMRWLRRGLLAMLLLVLLSPLILLGAMATEGGSRWLLERALSYAPGTASIAQIDGTLLHGITLEGVHYAHPAFTVESDRFSLALVMPALLQRRLAVNTLRAERLHITLHPGEEDSTEPEPDTTPFHIDQLDDINLPLSIAIHGASVTHFTLTLANGTDIVLDSILLAGSTDRDQLHLQQLFVSQGDYRISLGGKLGLHQPFHLDTWADWQAPVPDALRQTLEGPDAPADTEEAAPLLATADARVRGTLAELAIEHRLHTPLALRSDGMLRPFDQPLAFDLENSWQALTLYSADNQPLSLADGALAIRGTPEAYRLRLDSGTSLPDLPAITLSLLAEGDSQSLAIETARLDIAESHILISGDLAWAPTLSWDLNLAITDFDPGLLIQEMPGQLQVDARINGSLEDQQLTLGLALNELSGTLRQHRVSGGGHLQLARHADDALTDSRITSDLRLAAGANRVSLRGTAHQRLDLTLALEGNDLAALWPGLHGTLQLDGRVRGTRSNPMLEARISTPLAGFEGWRIEDLLLAVDARNGSEEPVMNLNLSTGALTRDGELLLERVATRGDGSASDHRIDWDITAPQGSTRGAVAGMLKELRAWQGMLRSLEVDSPISGLWQLDRPAALGFSAEAAHIAPACLVAEDSSLCLDGNWRAGGPIDARLDLSNLSLAYLARELPEDAAELEGHINLSASFQQRQGRNTGNADLQVSAGRLALSSGRDEPYELVWRGLSAHIDLQDTLLDANLVFDVDDTSGTRANLRAELAGNDTRLNGSLHTHLDDLGWVEALAPSLRNIRGRLRGDLTLSGTVSAPRFGGQLVLDEAAADVPEVGLSLQDIHLMAIARRSGELDLSGQVRSGDGEIRLTGDLDTREPLPWPLRLQIKGENFLAAQRPDARVEINPDLDISVARNLVTIRGEVTVPRAMFTPQELPQQAISVSRDEVILQDDEEEASLWKIDTDITVRLGDRVRISGFGLEARFAGAVRIEDKPGRTPRLIGEIRIEDGRYRAYGQNLHVERGTLIFQGPPDNPGLDIVAVRHVTAYNVRAGLAIGGTLQDPRSRIFSEPSMEETEAMSYLLTGRPLDSGSDADAAVIMQAIILYGIERGDFITNRLGQELGVEVGLDNEGEADEAALMLGKQLSSRLYLRYSIGLFEALNTVMLRYTLSRSLSLETRSNTRENAIDLIFRTER